MRPIDADELMYEIGYAPLADGFPYDKEWVDRLKSVIHMILDIVKNAPTVNGWISVKERLPEEYTKALVATEDGQMLVAAYTSDGWMYPCYGEKPTHWMPLPEPPEVEE